MLFHLQKNGIWLGWMDWQRIPDMKHPNHVFLLQDLFEKMLSYSKEQMGDVSFLESEQEDTEPWKKFFFVVPAAARPALSSCLGWGDGKPPEEGELP